jgi:hypothetical protein
VLLVETRNFHIEVNGNPTNILVPFADMINHEKDHDLEWNYNE